MAPLAAAAAHPDFARYTTGTPPSLEESWTRFLANFGCWQLFGFGYWTVADGATGEFLGSAGFLRARRDCDPPLPDWPEIGWGIVPAAWGRGFATEAALAVTRWGDATLGGARTICLIAPGNTASRRIAARCGYTESARTTYRGQASLVLERPGPSHV